MTTFLILLRCAGTIFIITFVRKAVPRARDPVYILIGALSPHDLLSVMPKLAPLAESFVPKI